MAVTGADYGSAVRRLPDGRVRLAHEIGPQALAPGMILPIAPAKSHGMHVVDSRGPFLSPDLRRDARISPPGPLLERGVVSGLAVPVLGPTAVGGVVAGSRSTSPRQLDDRDLPDVVSGALEDSGLAPGAPALELTGSAILAGADNRRALDGLRARGVGLFLDDIGTGYSSLTHLAQPPIQAVEVDRSSVAGLPDHPPHSALVSSLVTPGADLGPDVIAEGVETTAQLGALRAMGCRSVQGFLFDRPAADPVRTARTAAPPSGAG